VNHPPDTVFGSRKQSSKAAPRQKVGSFMIASNPRTAPENRAKEIHDFGVKKPPKT
jgi:hypothetical protein